MARTNEFVGKGWAFPLQQRPRGGLALVSGDAEIEQAIRLILGTMPGERVMRPTFGCRAWELVFAPNNETTRSLLVHYVEQALTFWEPRIELLAVTVTAAPFDDAYERRAHEHTLWVQIQYEIKTTHDPRSLVYPFYIMGEE